MNPVRRDIPRAGRGLVHNLARRLPCALLLSALLHGAVLVLLAQGLASPARFPLPLGLWRPLKVELMPAKRTARPAPQSSTSLPSLPSLPAQPPQPSVLPRAPVPPHRETPQAAVRPAVRPVSPATPREPPAPSPAAPSVPSPNTDLVTRSLEAARALGKEGKVGIGERGQGGEWENASVAPRPGGPGSYQAPRPGDAFREAPRGEGGVAQTLARHLRPVASAPVEQVQADGTRLIRYGPNRCVLIPRDVPHYREGNVAPTEYVVTTCPP